MYCFGDDSGHYKWAEYRGRSHRLHHLDPRLVLQPTMDSVQLKTFAWVIPRRTWEEVKGDWESTATWTNKG